MAGQKKEIPDENSVETALERPQAIGLVSSTTTLAEPFGIGR
jgi:hypothetical protein